MRSGPKESPDAISNSLILDPIKDKGLFDKAKRILTKCGTDKNVGELTKLEKTKGGFYRAHYSIYGSGRDISLLDLDFPFAQEDMRAVLDQYRGRYDLQMFLSLGPGQFDYPKKENGDPREETRIFFVVDNAFGLVDDREVKRERALFELNYYIPSHKIREERPDRTYIYNGLPYDAVENTFDVVQMVNVLSEPKGSIFQEHRSGEIGSYMRMVKPGVGELFIFNSNTPSSYPLDQVEREVQELGCSIDIFFHSPEGEHVRHDEESKVIPKELIQKLQREYHVDPVHWQHGHHEGSYAAVIRKPQKLDSSERS